MRELTFRFAVLAAVAALVLGFGYRTAHDGSISPPSLSDGMTIVSQMTQRAQVVLTPTTDVPRAAAFVTSDAAKTASMITATATGHPTAALAIMALLLATGAILLTSSALDYLRRTFASLLSEAQHGNPMWRQRTSGATTFDGGIDDVKKARRLRGRVAANPSSVAGIAHRLATVVGSLGTSSTASSSANPLVL